MAAAVDFYFDFSSPYGYFASTAIEALAAKYGRSVNWKPVLLGVLFKTSGAAPLTEVPLKGAYSRHDFERTARLHQIPFRLPQKFPVPTQAAMRAMLWTADAHGAARATALAHALFYALFVDGIDISAPDAVLQIGVSLGLDAQLLREGMDSDAVREQQKQENALAMQRGVFGAPFVIVDGEPFWGFDRFAQLEHFLAQTGAPAAPLTAERSASAPMLRKG